MPVNAFPREIYTNDSRVDYYQPLDLTDGSWTLNDPASFVDSVVNNAGTMELTLKAVGVANNELQPVGSAGQTEAPRWYKLAFYDDGTPVLAGETFVLSVSCALFGSTRGNLRYFNWGFGTFEDPTDDTVANMKANVVGVAWNFANTNADSFPYIASGAAPSTASPLSATDTRMFGTITMAGGNGGLVATGLDTSGLLESSGAALSSTTNYTPASGQLYVGLIAGARGTSRTYSAGDGTDFNVVYKFSRIAKVSARIS